jgi:hypothetical protein
MNIKDWVKSKSMWAAVAVAVCGVYTAVTGNAVPEAAYAILAGFGLVGIRDAVEKVNKNA